MFYEPLWLFYQGIDLAPRLEELRGRKLSIGPEGGGTRNLAMKLLALNGIEPRIAEMLPLAHAARLRVPVMFAHFNYALRLHIKRCSRALAKNLSYERAPTPFKLSA